MAPMIRLFKFYTKVRKMKNRIKCFYISFMRYIKTGKWSL
ncbi:hypothetical protein NU09_2812 [Flavobacterium beibuense]|uniref:Uncharacterized protein n=1 Tax=Flavobacterium beibuense TaxID=657326 RepID=A0A444W6Y5_9FLAO|nr:hypothetical protein NU09_2812 [Flavobacterium beibuense]